MGFDVFGFVGDAANAAIKYNPFTKPVTEVIKLVNNPQKSVDNLKDNQSHFVDDATDTWNDHKNEIGLTLIDTLYNVATGTESIPSKVRTTVVDTATNVIDAADGLGKDAVDAVKKYWPFALAGVVGVVALKAAAPEIIKKVLN